MKRDSLNFIILEKPLAFKLGVVYAAIEKEYCII
jgi:hypothetical protein